MQLFAQLPDDRLVVLEASPLETAGDVARRLEGEEQRSQANHCGGHTNHCRGAAEPLILGERRLVKGGFTLPEHSSPNHRSSSRLAPVGSFHTLFPQDSFRMRMVTRTER